MVTGYDAFLKGSDVRKEPQMGNPEDQEDEGTAPSGDDGEEVNDPLTRSDVEAPRADFEGRKQKPE